MTDINAEYTRLIAARDHLATLKDHLHELQNDLKDARRNVWMAMGEHGVDSFTAFDGMIITRYDDGKIIIRKPKKPDEK